jgi:hypothetical protein
MGPMLNAQDIVTRLKTISLPGQTLTVASAGMRDLKITFGTVFPAVYVLKQSSRSASPGGSSGMGSRPSIQTWDCYVEVCVVARRFTDSVLESDTARKELCDAVFDCLFGWTAPECFTSFDCDNYTDGDPADSVNYGIQRWHCTRTRRGT